MADAGSPDRSGQLRRPVAKGLVGKDSLTGGAITGLEDCIFCASPADSGEDIFPSWIRKRIPQPTGPMPVIHNVDGTDIDVWNAYQLTFLKLKAVCARCNNTWMSRIENKVARILLNMIVGTSITLSPEEQVDLATWASLKSIVFEPVAQYAEVSTASDRSILKLESRPPGHASVYLARYVPGDLFSVARRFVYGERRAGQVGHASLTTLVLGSAVISVLLSPLRETVDFAMTGKRRVDVITAFLPTPESALWPPHQGLDHEGLENFAGRFLIVGDDLGNG
jgi:hypothetical protein